MKEKKDALSVPTQERELLIFLEKKKVENTKTRAVSSYSLLSVRTAVEGFIHVLDYPPPPS